MSALQTRAQDEAGFSLIELLVVIIVIGVLAAIAIPSFLSHKGKAADAQAKELVRTAQTAAETIATDNGGSYSTIKEAKQLHDVEASIPYQETKDSAWLSTARATEEGKGFEVIVTAEPDGNTFAIKHTGQGAVKHECVTPSGKGEGGCPASGGSW